MVSQHGLALHCGTLQRRRIRLARIWVTPALSQRLEQSAVTQTRLRRRFAFQAALQFHVRWLLRPKCHRPRPPLQYPHHLSLRAGQIFALSPTPDQVRPRVWLAARARAGAKLAAADVMLIAGEPGLVIATDGKVERVLTFAIAEGQIAAIEVISDPERLARLELRLLDGLADQAH